MFKNKCAIFISSSFNKHEMHTKRVPAVRIWAKQRDHSVNRSTLLNKINTVKLRDSIWLKSLRFLSPFIDKNKNLPIEYNVFSDNDSPGLHGDASCNPSIYNSLRFDDHVSSTRASFTVSAVFQSYTYLEKSSGMILIDILESIWRFLFLHWERLNH